MVRIIIYLLIVLGLGFLFAWIADRPGNVVVDWQGQQFETSLMVAVAALVALVIALLVIWWTARIILTSPAIMSRFFAGRRKERGYTALSQGMIAASSGNAIKARKLAKESGRLLSNEPLVGLLDAQTSLLEGRRDKARDQYGKMLDNDETRVLALRGLFIEAEREGASDAARQYASEAAELEPSLPWAGTAMLRFNAAERDWEAALDRLESNRAAGVIEKDLATRQRAVLLTAQAFDEEMANPERAAKLAQLAHKLDPELVPAAVIGARAYTRIGDIKRASRIIEDVWRKTPHPELADAYTHVRSGDSVADRLARAKHLASLKSHHPESNMAITLAAIDANDWHAARDAMQSVVTTNLTERACLIMADIEEGEHGDRGRMRDWLSRAVRAPRDPVWTADGYVSESWLPMSPVTGNIGAFEWKVPVEQLGEPAPVLDVSELAEPLAIGPEPQVVKDAIVASAAIGAAVAATSVENEADPVEAEPVMASSSQVMEKPAQQETDQPAIDPETSGLETDETPSTVEVEEDVVEAEVIELKPALEEKAIAEAEAKEEENQEVETAQTSETVLSNDAADESVGEEAPKLVDNKVEFPLKQRPDDPGVDPEKVPEKKRFGLF